MSYVAKDFGFLSEAAFASFLTNPDLIKFQIDSIKADFQDQLRKIVHIQFQSDETENVMMIKLYSEWERTHIKQLDEIFLKIMFLTDSLYMLWPD